MVPDRFYGFLIIVLSAFLLFSCNEHVKEPAVAGSFYPSDSDELKVLVDDLLSGVKKKPDDGQLVALIAPHAGYRYSGKVAAYTYDHLRKNEVHTVILIGPSHQTSFKGVSVYTKGSMRTPLGITKINEGLAGDLVSEENEVYDYPEAFMKEHSLEVQLPFLQMTKEGVRVVPLLVGMATERSFSFLTEKIIDLLRNDKGIIVIASTDLSHYHEYDTAMHMDQKIIDAVERMSLEDVHRLIQSREAEMCGAYPVIYTMAIARGLGATNGVLYKYANSGDVTGDRKSVVGYAAMGLYRTGLSSDQRDYLLKLARSTIETYIKKGQVPEISVHDMRLRANGATFVTINRQGRLRGCIGNIQPTMPLYQSVVMNATAACSRDPRFPVMTENELIDMDIEVTVLSPLEPLNDLESITIGQHGLFLVKGNHSGLLLPQVPEEFGWDRSTFLEQVSLKAGLDRNAWKTADLFRFTADIIKEHP